jgi:hypothetical protein
MRFLSRIIRRIMASPLADEALRNLRFHVEPPWNLACRRFWRWPFPPGSALDGATAPGLAG